MSCCSTCSCPIQPCPSRYAPWLLRIGFGLTLAAYGVNHYKNIGMFAEMAQGVFSVSILATIAGLLAYIFPALMIVGGVLFAVKQMHCIAKTCIYAALGGIIGWAGLAVLLGDAQSGPNMMPLIQNACVFLITYYVIKKMSCCGSSCMPAMGGK